MSADLTPRFDDVSFQARTGTAHMNTLEVIDLGRYPLRKPIVWNQIEMALPG